MSAAKNPDKRVVLRDLAQKLATAYLAELLARKKFQDADEVRHGARTPTAEDLAAIRAAKKGYAIRSRARLMIEAEMANVLGLKPDDRKPPGEIIDSAPDPE